MRTHDIQVGNEYYCDGAGAVTVLNTASTKAPHFSMLAGEFQESQEQLRQGSIDPYWRGSSLASVCVRTQQGRVLWTQARYISELQN